MPASSNLVWPGFCLAPAVITTTDAPATQEMSPPPDTFEVPVNWVPWARSSTSASVFAASMSYRITSEADRRIRAEYASDVPTLPAPTTASRERRLMG